LPEDYPCPDGNCKLRFADVPSLVEHRNQAYAAKLQQNLEELGMTFTKKLDELSHKIEEIPKGHDFDTEKCKGDSCKSSLHKTVIELKKTTPEEMFVPSWRKAA
jgi:hypothetical protein